jgi:hypothetical protein
MQISLSLSDIVNGVQVPASIEEVADGGQVMTFTAESKDKAIPLARKLVRELSRFRVANYTGTHSGETVTLRFGIPGATPPASWTASRSGKSEKPALLAEVQEELKKAGFKSGYFNSGSVTQQEGIVLQDDQVPVGIQFTLDDDGVLEVRTLRGPGKWYVAAIDGPADAVRIVKNATRIFDLS